MTKEQVSQRVLQNGKPLDLDKFEWNEKAKVFSTTENGLVIDFSNQHYCTFDTGAYCTFKTGHNCTFKTGHNCTFKTSSGCIFKTSSNCTFNTDYNCTFNTGAYCTFDTGSNCIFDTVHNCTFDTSPNCIVVRRDVYEVIELNRKGKIKLHGFGVKGYTTVKETYTITIDGKDIEISKESMEALKKSLN